MGGDRHGIGGRLPPELANKPECRQWHDDGERQAEAAARGGLK